MNYVLGTDIIIYYLKNHPVVTKQVQSLDIDKLSITIITHAELLFGCYKSNFIEQNLNKLKPLFEVLTILEFDKESSYQFAQLKASLQKLGITIADMDLMIASICLSNQATLVTNNTKHFERIPYLKIENWT